MSQKVSFYAVVLSLCLIVTAANSQTQRTQSSMQQTPGTFKGQLTGAGMDAATVTFTNNSTGAAQSATTDSAGAFTFNNLAPGTYKVSVRMKSGLQLGESSIEINAANSNQVQVNFAATPAAPAAKLELEGT